MSVNFDSSEFFARLVKYAAEGLVVGFVCMILPKKSLSWDEALLIALVAACMFSILDLVSPSIGASARQGVGMGAGFNLVGFP